MNIVLVALNEFRLVLMRTFFKKKYRNKFALRKGTCIQCGSCCRACGCDLLDVNNNCSVFPHRPLACHSDFPVDKWHQQVVGVEDKCGFYFDEK